MTDTPWHLKNYKNTLNSRLRLVPVVEEVLVREQLNSTRDTLHLHPSEICKKDWCPRSSWYTIKGYEKDEKPFAFQTLNIFAEGHAIHAKWQSWLQEAGVMEAVEAPISNDEYMLLGHADGIINDKKGRAILEIKSVGAGTIRMEDFELFSTSSSPDEMWKKVRQPFMTHLRQVNLYMFCLDIHDAVFIYEWKATQEVKEFSVKYQPHLIEGILAGCKSVIRALESGIPPMRPMWIEDSSNKACKACPYKKVCWKEDNDAPTSTQVTLDGGLFQ
jgi:CRISPR/Cas system-associated exonuclease Cas4 (RecB family)